MQKYKKGVFSQKGKIYDAEKFKEEIAKKKSKRECDNCKKSIKMSQLKFDNKHRLICLECRRK